MKPVETLSFRTLASMPDQETIKEMLSGPEYFHCTTTHTTMKKRHCVARQTEGIITIGNRREIPVTCQDCAQGREIMEETGTESAEARPKRCATCGEEEIYARGLCRKCYQKQYYKKQKGGPNPPPGPRPENPVIPPGPPKGGTGKSKASERPEGPEHIPDIDAAIMLDFGAHTALLESLQRLAHEECRTPAQQALWIIKKALGC